MNVKGKKSLRVTQNGSVVWGNQRMLCPLASSAPHEAGCSVNCVCFKLSYDEAKDRFFAVCRAFSHPIEIGILSIDERIPE